MSKVYLKKIITVFLCAATAFLAFGMAACDDGECNHEWNSGVITTEATCTQDGVMLYTCTLCGETKTQAIAATGHTYSDGYVNTDAQGHYHICTECGETDEVVAHTFEDTEVLQAATETQEGLMGTLCAVCGYEGTREIPVISHIASSDWASDDNYHWQECCEHDDCNVIFNKAVHSWDDGTVINEATDTEDGSMLYTCTVCGKTKTESIAATGQSSYNTGADFAKDFTTDNQDGAWSYGIISYSWSAENQLTYSSGSESFSFTAATELNSGSDGWVAGNAEIKAGWINAGDMTGIAYTASSDITAQIALTYTGATDDTALSLRIAVVSADGTTISFISNAKDYTFYSIFDFNNGDTIYFIFNNEGAGVPRADLSISINELSVVADFTDDFSTVSSMGTWYYGTVEYSWKADNQLTYINGDESFSFTAATELNSESDGWVAGNSEIKAGWINAGDMTGIAYTASSDITAQIALTYTGATDDTALSLRVAVVSADGTTISFKSNAKTYSYAETVDLKTGDTVYFIFNNEASDTESAYPQADISITIYGRL